jgi:hypothetical protein
VKEILTSGGVRAARMGRPRLGTRAFSSTAGTMSSIFTNVVLIRHLLEKRMLFAAQNIFSTIRFASPRMVPEEIFIRAQSFLSLFDRI